MCLIDTHAHLNDRSLTEQIDEVLARAQQAGVQQIVTVATTLASSLECVELARKNTQVYASVGIHPNHSAEAEAGDWEQIVHLAGAPKVVALGETGLDGYWNDAPMDLQRQFFQRHWQLSQETGLPVIVHMRDCAEAIVEELQVASRKGPLHGVMHSFTGDQRLADVCLELGLYVSFAGMVTFKKSDALRTVAAHIPADRILVETDSPYLSPDPLRGKRPNEPSRVVYTADCIAKARGMSRREFAEQTTRNARQLFHLPEG